jgi:SsrA-binding protein
MATLVENKKARLRFSILETYSAGLELSGAEVKSLRSKHGSLDGARVVVRAGEAYLVGASIPPYQMANTPKEYEAEKTRRLLLNKKEIAELGEAESKKGLTVVPLEVYNAGRFVKLRLAIVKGKGQEDRREDLKRATDMREAERDARGKR